MLIFFFSLEKDFKRKVKTYPSEENTKEHKLSAVKCRATKRNSTVDFRKETLPGHKLPMHILHVSSKILCVCGGAWCSQV